MVVTRFPPVDSADADGLLALGGDLEVASLLRAYRSGIFPWPLGDGTLAWFSPPERGILFSDAFHLSRSTKKALKRHAFQTTFNRACAEVIRACKDSPNRKGQRGTWITEEMALAYTELHKQGACQSCEVWRDGMLVGGLYGVTIGGMFAGESMFHQESHASKLALWALMERITELGLPGIDCQVVTPLLASFGAEELPRSAFMPLLKSALGRPAFRLER